MLNRQETESEQSTTTGATGRNRVTPEELSSALAAIEARKQAEASRLAGTIPIEEAVTELHLDSTPDEIWAEVQAQREKRPTSLPSSFAEAEAARREQLRLAPTVFHQAQKTFTPQTLLPGKGKRRGWFKTIAVAAVIWSVFHSTVLPHFRHHAQQNTPAVFQTLSQIPDGKEVNCDTASLVQISEGKPLTQVSGAVSGAPANTWTLVKMGGHIYLRGYTLDKATAALPGKPLDILNDDNAGELEDEKTARVTLRVDDVPLQTSGGGEGYSEITFPHFQPDARTSVTPWR